MGTFSVVPVFGETFQKFFPLTLLFFVLFNMTDVYGKLMKVLGMKHWDFNRNNGDELQTEGKLIVQKRRLASLDRLREMNKRSKPGLRRFDDDIDEIFSPVSSA